MSDELQPWEQQPGEPNRWYEVFFAFFTAGSNRSLLGVYNQQRQAKGKQGDARRVPGAWDRQCRKWNWRERAAAWDAEQRRLRSLKLAERIDRMIDSQATLGAAMWGVGAQGLDQVNSAELDIQDRIKLIESGVRIERQALGEPDAIVKRQGDAEAQVTNNLTLNLADVVRQLREAERQEQEQQEQLEHQADGPARIANRASANGNQVNGHGG